MKKEYKLLIDNLDILVEKYDFAKTHNDNLDLDVYIRKNDLFNELVVISKEGIAASTLEIYIEDLIKDGIVSVKYYCCQKCLKEKVSLYKYNDKILCSKCLYTAVNNDGLLESETVYYYNGIEIPNSSIDAADFFVRQNLAEYYYGNMEVN